MTAQGPCRDCDSPTCQAWGRHFLCWSCRSRRWPQRVKRGRPLGRAVAPDVYELECVTCHATWTGGAWERCSWCAWAEENQREAQRTLVLLEPDYDIDENDKELQNRIEAWSARLTIAIQAGVVTADEADNAVEAWVRKVEQWR